MVIILFLFVEVYCPQSFVLYFSQRNGTRTRLGLSKAESDSESDSASDSDGLGKVKNSRNLEIFKDLKLVSSTLYSNTP